MKIISAVHPGVTPAVFSRTALDYNKSPFLVIWEVTRACDLACMHCRAEAQSQALPGELNHEEGLSVIDQVVDMGTPILVLSGGDPLKRKDLLSLIHYGKTKGLRMGTIPAATSLLTRDVVAALKEAGLDQMALSLDAPTAMAHDRFRQVPGAYAKTMEAIKWAHEMKLPLQINTVIGRHNIDQLDDLIRKIRSFDVVFWEVFFLVPVGRGEEVQDISAEQYEEVFKKLYQVMIKEKFIVKVTEAPHFRRYSIQKKLQDGGISLDAFTGGHVELPVHLRRLFGPGRSIGQAPQSVNSGKGFVFVSYDGKVYPSGFLPISAGTVEDRGLIRAYRDSLLFQRMRDSSLLKGRCGCCEYRDLCGGSRSRAFAETGDYLEEDSRCAHRPSRVLLNYRL